MKIFIKTCVVISLIASYGCGKKSNNDSHKDPEAKNKLDTKVKGADPKSTPQSKDGKALKPLVTRTLEELIADVTKDFSPTAASNDEISDLLKTTDKTFSSTGLEHLINPQGAAAQTDEKDPDLEEGGTCKALYYGINTIDWKRVLGSFDIKQIRMTIRYGVDEQELKNFSRKKIAIPSFASVSYQELTTESKDNNDWQNGSRQKTVHIGKSGGKILIVTEDIRTPTDASELDDFREERCALLMDFEAQSIKRSCSEANYVSLGLLRQENSMMTEVFKAGSYAKQASVQKIYDGLKSGWNANFKQTSPLEATFMHDFRDSATSADGGIFFGAFFPAYSYAEGSIEYSSKPVADSATDLKPKITDCKVKSVKFEP